MSKFEELLKLNVNDKVEKKDNLSYLSWAWAWTEFKKAYPEATYEVVKFDGLPYAYDERTGYMVYTKVTAEGLTHEMWLPVMDGANKAMKSEPYTYTVKNSYFKYAKLANDGKYYDKFGNEQTEYTEKSVKAATMFDVNKTIMRCLTKNLAMFGLGLYIYAGEDLPESEQSEPPAPNEIITPVCPKCGKPVTEIKRKDGVVLTPQGVMESFGMCFACKKKENSKKAEVKPDINAEPEMAEHADNYGDRV